MDREDEKDEKDEKGKKGKKGWWEGRSSKWEGMCS
jgi:hypothetical protein